MNDESYMKEKLDEIASELHAFTGIRPTVGPTGVYITLKRRTSVITFSYRLSLYLKTIGYTKCGDPVCVIAYELKQNDTGYFATKQDLSGMLLLPDTVGNLRKAANDLDEGFLSKFKYRTKVFDTFLGTIVDEIREYAR